MVHKSNARFKIIAAGIRSGKDCCCNNEFFTHLVNCANKQNSSVAHITGWIIAPTELVAQQSWRDLKEIISPELIADENSSDMEMKLTNGITVKAYSSFGDIDLSKTVAVDAVIITEAARIESLETIWKFVKKCLEYNNGIALVNSTPFGKNYFYQMLCMGNHNHPAYDPNFESFHWTTWDNPKQSNKRYVLQPNFKTFEENVKFKFGEKQYLQDYMAEFLD